MLASSIEQVGGVLTLSNNRVFSGCPRSRYPPHLCRRIRNSFPELSTSTSAYPAGISSRPCCAEPLPGIELPGLLRRTSHAMPATTIMKIKSSMMTYPEPH